MAAFGAALPVPPDAAKRRVLPLNSHRQGQPTCFRMVDKRYSWPGRVEDWREELAFARLVFSVPLAGAR
jgi:hypothetical protein